MLTPARRRGIELLDDASVADDVRARAIADVARANRWLGGTRALRLALDEVLRARARASRELVLLDVGTGAGDLARLARERARRASIPLRVVGVDLVPSLARAARDAGALHHGVAADVQRLPFADGAVDVAICSQLLHHFEEADARRVVAELSRVARTVVVSDLRRSWIAAAGFWLVSWPLRFHPITRHDGVVSVLRGFTVGELRGIVRGASGRAPSVRRRLGWRVLAVWDA